MSPPLSESKTRLRGFEGYIPVRKTESDQILQEINK